MTFSFTQLCAAFNSRGYTITAGTLRNRLMEIAPEEATQNMRGRWLIIVKDEEHLLRLAQRLVGLTRKGK